MTTENVILSTTENIISGSVCPLTPPQSTIRAYRLNGHTEQHEDIREAYGHGVGYIFKWGHILEERETYMGITTVFWGFCFDSLLEIYLNENNHLDALSDISLMAMRCLDIPDYVAYDEGGSVDAFTMWIDSTKEKLARKWLATHFLGKPLHYIFATCERYSHIDSDLARRMYLVGVEL